MTLLKFGRPAGAIMQFAYSVRDIDVAMRDYIEGLKIGPWFVTGPFHSETAIYRGRVSPVTVTLAMAFSGPMMIELVQQHNTAPSAHLELVNKRGYGFHHWAIMTRTFDQDVATYNAKGCDTVFSDISPRGTRIAYLDTTDRLPGMLELIEHTEFIEGAYGKMYEASLGWDGSDPIRRPALKIPRS